MRIVATEAGTREREGKNSRHFVQGSRESAKNVRDNGVEHVRQEKQDREIEVPSKVRGAKETRRKAEISDICMHIYIYIYIYIYI